MVLILWVGGVGRVHTLPCSGLLLSAPGSFPVVLRRPCGAGDQTGVCRMQGKHLNSPVLSLWLSDYHFLTWEHSDGYTGTIKKNCGYYLEFREMNYIFCFPIKLVIYFGV